MDDSDLDRLLSGDLERLVQLPKRVVRLFISSTFTDMTLERNTLMERVYPRLKKYCRERHGLDFQVVDMRWGVRDEATDDHQTVNLCSREILNCQRMSLGPNFVALLGDKYGFRPLCNRIKSTEYRAIRRCLIELDINTDFLDTWYKEDLNAVPPEYLLQPISSILKNFTNKSEPDLQSLDQRIWQAIQERLHELLMIGSSRLVKQGRMSEQEQLKKYSISVTEREVIEGCLDLNEAKSHCLIYIRSITDLQQHLDECLAKLSSSQAERVLNTLSPIQDQNDDSGGGSKTVRERRDSQPRKASLKIGNDTISLTTSVAQTAAERRVEKTRRLIGKYIDLSSRDNVWRVDDEAQAALANLKGAKLETKLRSNRRNLTKFQVPWNEQEGISLKSEEHKRYMNELTEHFYNNLTRMIRRASRNESVQGFKAGLLGEVLQHSHYARHVSKTFYGRNEELDKIHAYFRGPSAKPMFIYGVGGSGKTSILARVATLAKDWIQRAQGLSSGPNVEVRWNERPCVVTRFCGTTPNCSSMVGVLTSVCRQLQFHFYQYGPLNGAQVNQSGRTLVLDGLDDYDSGGGRMADAEAQLEWQPVPEDFVRLVFTFRKLLDNCQHRFHRQRTFLIILDSVERLSWPAESSVEVKYSWLTSIAKLPANVKLIVSCSSEKTSEIWGDDYLLLKRHFLQSYFDSTITTLSTARGEPGGERSQASSPADDRSYASSRRMDSPRADLMNSSDAKSSNLAESNNDRYQMLKRVLVPAVRLMRGLERKHRPKSHTTVSRQRTLKSSLAAVIGKVPVASGWTLGGRRTNRTALPVNVSGQLNSNLLNSLSNSNEQLANWSHGQSEWWQGVWILHVRPLGVELALSVVKRWLSEAGRNLSQQQWAIVERSFAHCSRPIFVKLAFGEIVNWKSYSIQSDTKGLTFGSSLLEKSNEIINKFHSSADVALEKLMADSESGDSATTEDEFKWQILSMEQQWLNYVDYRQREQQQAANVAAPDSNGGAKSGYHEENKKEDNGSIVIRVGAFTSSKSYGSTGSSSISASICYLSNTIDDAICQLFARIELQHGYVLTKHSLSYITAARNGICENELEDILSLDDVVLDDVFQYHLPPVRRIPPLLWTRIRNDLPDYLSERDADGIVVNWHHSQFKQVTQRRYLSDPQQVYYIHSNLADYFLGKWADKAKPFRCTKQQIQMAAEQLESAVQQSIRDSQTFAGGGHHQRPSIYYTGRLSNGSMGVRTGISLGAHNRLRSSQYDQRLQLMQAKADRRVPHQPLFYAASQAASSVEMSLGDGQRQATEQRGVVHPGGNKKGDEQAGRRYNLRKLTELPHHLMRSGRFRDLANHVLFNYKWLFAALEALGLQSVLSDFNEAAKSLAKALESPETLPSGGGQRFSGLDFDLELRGSSGEPESLEPIQLASMIRQLKVLNDTVRLSCSAIHQDPQMLAPQLIGRLMPLVRAPTGGGGQQQASQECKYLVQLLEQCDKDGSLDCALLPIDHCLQAPDGLQLSSLEGHSFAITSMAMTADQRHLLAVSNKFVMWDIGTGEVSRDVDPNIEGSIMKQLKMGLNNEFALAYTSNNVILVLDILTQQVAKFYGLVGGKKSNNVNPGEHEHYDGQGEKPILGLELIDQFSATRFVVWTETSWFVMRVVNSELQGSSVAFMAQRISVQLDYCVDLARFNAMGRILRAQLVSTCHSDEEVDTAFVETELANNNSNNGANGNGALKVQLLTLETSRLRDQAEDEWRCEMWEERLEASALALDPGQRLQLFFADSLGNIHLSRRRRTRWSKPKLIIRAAAAEPDKTSGRGNELSLAAEISGAAINFADVSQGSAALPLAIEAEPYGVEYTNDTGSLESTAVANLAQFERQIDALQADAEIDENCVFKLDQASSARLSAGQNKKRAARLRAAGSPPPVRLLKLYLSTKIIIVRLDGRNESERVRCLNLPKNIRNISVEPNRCQIKSLLLSASCRPATPGQLDYLVAAVGRRLLLYSIDNEQFLKSVDAHSGRIVQMIPIFASARSSGAREASQRGAHLSVASASMDKSVKVWDFSKADKEAHALDKLAGSIESLQLAPQRPLAACLSRGELAVWDWHRLKLVARLAHSDLSPAAPSCGEKQQQQPRAGQQPGDAAAGRVVKCRFSSNGRYLSLATLECVKVFALDGASGARFASSVTDKKVSLKLVFERRLPVAGWVRRLNFMLQDSRLLTVLDCGAGNSSGAGVGHSTPSSAGSSRAETGASTEPAASAAQWHLVRRLLVMCHSLPDGRQLYAIDCLTPTLQGANESHYYAAGLQAPSATGERRAAPRSEPSRALKCSSLVPIRLPVLTRDHLHVVSVGLGELGAGGQQTSAPAAERRKSSAASKLPAILNVHSTRDGSLVHSINLSQLELYNAPVVRPPPGRQSAAASGHSRRDTSPSVGARQQQQICIGNDHFSRLKPVLYLERQSIVALIDDDKGASFLVDVNARQLVACVAAWNGKVSSDGRFGLSRLCKATSSRAAGSAGGELRQANNGPAVAPGGGGSAGGLQLLEMRRCQPIKSLLSGETLARLEAADSQAAGGDTDATSGFTRPNDAYVYYYNSRLRRLLLVRLGDAQLIANYKLASQATKIKCSPDGLALVLGFADGSLASLAIVDGQRSDTLARLAEYPSRKRAQ